MIALLIIAIIVVIALGIFLAPDITNILNNNPTTSQSILPSDNANSSQVNGIKVSIQSSNHIDGEGLTSKEKTDAIAVALENETVMETAREFSFNITVGNVASADILKHSEFDSGFLNMSSKIASVPIRFDGIMTSSIGGFDVYVDVANNRTLGYVEDEVKAGPYAYVMIPPGTYWYHQLNGMAFIYKPGNLAEFAQGDYTEMTPRVVLNVNDTNSIYPMILSTDNMEKFINGSPYNALRYVDYATNGSMIMDSSRPMTPVYIYNETAVWQANVSISHDLPLDNNYFNPRYYYLILENKNNEKEIDIAYFNIDV